MKPLKMQPTFTVDLPVDVEIAIASLREAIKQPGLSEHTVAAGSCIEFQVPPTEQHFWSPHLSIQLSAREQGCQIFGRFSPRPEIWTMFMAVYAVLIAVMFGAAIFGYVQWALGKSPWSLALVPLGLIIIASLHLASLIGQRLSADEMRELRSRLNQAIESARPSFESAASQSDPTD